MSEFKGTKGKWDIDSSSDSRVKLVGGLIDVWIYRNSGDIDIMEAKANAQLISKAPEMLEMLKEAKRVICSMKLSMWVHPDCSEGSEFYDMATTGEETEDKIEQLIKEATI